MQGSQTITAPDIHMQNDMSQAYFTVGALKFSLMSLTTFGIYELYWFYRNWRVIKNRDKSKILPFWRALFWPFWTFSLMSRFNEDSKDQNIPMVLPAITLGVVYIVLNGLWRLPDPYWLFSLLTFIPLLCFDAFARRLNGGGQLADPTFSRFSGWNIAWLIIGAILLTLAVAGAFMPEYLI